MNELVEKQPENGVYILTTEEKLTAQNIMLKRQLFDAQQQLLTQRIGIDQQALSREIGTRLGLTPKQLAHANIDADSGTLALKVTPEDQLDPGGKLP
mgnify:CR=1 FL=1